jgi:hypothetical protein
VVLDSPPTKPVQAPAVKKHDDFSDYDDDDESSEEDFFAPKKKPAEIKIVKAPEKK